MSLTAPPPVQDPAPCDVDDAVIKEAKRRARRRRWSYSGLVVALATVVAFVAWGPHRPCRVHQPPAVAVAVPVPSPREGPARMRTTRRCCGSGSSGCRPREPCRAAPPPGTWCSR